MRKLFMLTSAVLLFLAPVQSKANVPTVVFHGMHDNCENNAQLVDLLADGTKAHVECIEIGNGVSTSMWTKFMEQAKEACKKVQDH